MKTIWKFHADIDDEFDITIPEGAKVLSVAIQGGAPCIWALVDPDARPVSRRFYWLGTGHPVGDRDIGRFVGTVLMAGGSLVFHLFEALR